MLLNFMQVLIYFVCRFVFQTNTLLLYFIGACDQKQSLGFGLTNTVWKVSLSCRNQYTTTK